MGNKMSQQGNQDIKTWLHHYLKDISVQLMQNLVMLEQN
jgi:hypothetical protein